MLLPLSAFVRIKLLLIIFRDSFFSVTFKLVAVLPNLPGLPLPGSFQFITCFGIRVSGVLCTCPSYVSCLSLSTIVCVSCIISPICLFVTLSSLELRAALRHKSISVASNIHFVISLSSHISQLYVVILFIMVSYISLLLLLFMFLS